jgi:hypothetical protein
MYSRLQRLANDFVSVADQAALIDEEAVNEVDQAGVQDARARF